jgi:hypothetical protein
VNLDKRIQECLRTSKATDRCFLTVTPGEVLSYTTADGEVKTCKPLVDVVEVTEIVNAYRSKS